MNVREAESRCLSFRFQAEKYANIHVFWNNFRPTDIIYKHTHTQCGNFRKLLRFWFSCIISVTSVVFSFAYSWGKKTNASQTFQIGCFKINVCANNLKKKSQLYHEILIPSCNHHFGSLRANRIGQTFGGTKYRRFWNPKAPLVHEFDMFDEINTHSANIWQRFRRLFVSSLVQLATRRIPRACHYAPRIHRIQRQIGRCNRARFRIDNLICDTVHMIREIRMLVCAVRVRMRMRSEPNYVQQIDLSHSFYAIERAIDCE